MLQWIIPAVLPVSICLCTICIFFCLLLLFVSSITYFSRYLECIRSASAKFLRFQPQLSTWVRSSDPISDQVCVARAIWMEVAKLLISDLDHCINWEGFSRDSVSLLMPEDFRVFENVSFIQKTKCTLKIHTEKQIFLTPEIYLFLKKILL